MYELIPVDRLLDACVGFVLGMNPAQGNPHMKELDETVNVFLSITDEVTTHPTVKK